MRQKISTPTQPVLNSKDKLTYAIILQLSILFLTFGSLFSSDDCEIPLQPLLFSYFFGFLISIFLTFLLLISYRPRLIKTLLLLDFLLFCVVSLISFVSILNQPNCYKTWAFGYILLVSLLSVFGLLGVALVLVYFHSLLSARFCGDSLSVEKYSNKLKT